MKKLFLASSFVQVSDKLNLLIPDPKGLKAVFVSTARDPYETSPWADADFHKLQELGMDVSMWDMKGKNEQQIYEELKNVDVIFVCGGNSFYLLYHAQQSGFDKAVIRLVNEGKVYIGSSAGSMLAGATLELTKNIDRMSVVPDLKDLNALKIVDFVILPHMNDKEKYGPRNDKIIAEYKGEIKLIPLKDDQVVIVEDSKYKVI